jgi:hypothetical protein
MLPRGKAGTARREAAASGRRWESIRDANGRVTAARDMVKGVDFPSGQVMQQKRKVDGAGGVERRRSAGGKIKSCGELHMHQLVGLRNAKTGRPR